MQKNTSNPKYLMSNELLNLSDKFYRALQNLWIWTFILQYVGHVFETLE
jgi:hypothetical protein